MVCQHCLSKYNLGCIYCNSNYVKQLAAIKLKNKRGFNINNSGLSWHEKQRKCEAKIAMKDINSDKKKNVKRLKKTKHKIYNIKKLLWKKNKEQLDVQHSIKKRHFLLERTYENYKKCKLNEEDAEFKIWRYKLKHNDISDDFIFEQQKEASRWGNYAKGALFDLNKHNKKIKLLEKYFDDINNFIKSSTQLINTFETKLKYYTDQNDYYNRLVDNINLPTY